MPRQTILFSWFQTDSIGPVREPRKGEELSARQVEDVVPCKASQRDARHILQPQTEKIFPRFQLLWHQVNIPRALEAFILQDFWFVAIVDGLDHIDYAWAEALIQNLLQLYVLDRLLDTIHVWIHCKCLSEPREGLFLVLDGLEAETEARQAPEVVRFQRQDAVAVRHGLAILLQEEQGGGPLIPRLREIRSLFDHLCVNLEGLFKLPLVDECLGFAHRHVQALDSRSGPTAPE
mmetsp:Transcript_57640/g.153541  ORF Transcript_57640/g.153541 Transcript_57640/m.153541 type:complete len:234 (+) Transcript_57640:204-905(+)